MMLPARKAHQISIILFYTCLFFFSIQCSAQSNNGFIKGKVIDGVSHLALSGVSILKEGGSIKTTTAVDGDYILPLKKGKHKLIYKSNEFETKVILDVTILSNQTTHLNIILFPVSKKFIDSTKKRVVNDSIKSPDSIVSTSFYKEVNKTMYNKLRHTSGQIDFIANQNIDAANDKNGAQLLKRLNGVIVHDFPATPNVQSFTIMGLGDRYNQVMLNGSLLNSAVALNKLYPINMLPADAIENVSVQKIANSSIPAEFAGGSIEIKTKEFPVQNFISLQLGAGYADATKGKDFFSDKRNKWEALSFPGSIRALNKEFPTVKSPSNFNSKNPQEKVFLSKLLNNNLAPINQGASKLNEQFCIGFGKTIQYKDGKKIGIIGFLSQSKTELIDENIIQAAPDIRANPFLVKDNNKELITAQAKDINYRYAAQMGGILNATIAYRQNKISLKNFFGSQFSNTYTRRTEVYKPDQDTLAHDGINYLTTQTKFLISQLSGEHHLGNNGKLILNWQANYSYSQQQNPDERSFLLRKDSAYRDRYEIARPLVGPFIPRGNTSNLIDPDMLNSARLWRRQTDNNFEGSVTITTPFNLFNQPQIISGGINIQTKNRVLRSDLLSTKGNGYTTLDSLVAPERYYPGGLSVRNYFSNRVGNYIQPYNRGNYTASANFGTSFIRLQNQLTKSLSVDWGARIESAAQLVSNAEYLYSKGFRYPEFLQFDKNTFVSKINFLPSLLVKYQLLHTLQLQAAFNKTVNRPMLQELTSYQYYDPLTFLVKIGNPIIVPATITNYNAGFNWLFNAGSAISIAAFYKEIDQPIENILSAYTSATVLMKPHNTAPATIKGIEVNFKVQLGKISHASYLSNFSLFGNGTWLSSTVKAGPVRYLSLPVREHTLTNSPNYTINAGLIFQQVGLPQVTILYNRIGDYITALGYGKLNTLTNGNSITDLPDYRVKERTQLDIQIGQKIFKNNILITVGVTNLLKNDFVVYQDLDGNKKMDDPITLKTINGHAGYYQAGTDNTITSIKSQPAYYFTIAYLFK